MSLDLNELLRDWPYEPGQLKVRKVAGLDGREKLQLRTDLGVIQMEVQGRPDGKVPHGYESLLEYQQDQAKKAENTSKEFTLSGDEVGDLQQEGIQYYHRYISLFHLGDFEAVVRDTQRNLDMFAFVAEHAESDELSDSVLQFSPYVLMMNTRARASIELERDDFHAAIAQVQRGVERIRAFYEEEGDAEDVENSAELAFLTEWMEELKSKQPLSKLERLEREMQRAIAQEAYEKAAELRDAIRAHRQRKEPKV